MASRTKRQDTHHVSYRLFSKPRPRSSADRASASGAVCAGSSPAEGAPYFRTDQRKRPGSSGAALTAGYRLFPWFAARSGRTVGGARPSRAPASMRRLPSPGARPTPRRRVLDALRPQARPRRCRTAPRACGPSVHNQVLRRRARERRSQQLLAMDRNRGMDAMSLTESW